MGTHLYVCDNGGPLVVSTDGSPPRWVTCPACATIECDRCDGAQLSGETDEFSGGESAVYRCEAGHQKTLRMRNGVGLPESAQCPECDGMMLLVPSPAAKH